MDPTITERLLELNRTFYEGYAQSFSSTRYSIQPGIQRLLPQMLTKERILDLGCGNGNLAKALHQAGFEGCYLGIDNSQGLLNEAKSGISAETSGRFRFEQADLAQPLKIDAEVKFDAVVCFAVLHHFPQDPYLRQIFSTVEAFLIPIGSFFLSSWQIKNNQRLRNRILSWDLAGIAPSEMSEDDLLLDWRADPSQAPYYRYVRHYDSETLQKAGQECGLSLKDEFNSDGKEGNLALYQHWQKPA